MRSLTSVVSDSLHVRAAILHVLAEGLSRLLTPASRDFFTNITQDRKPNLKACAMKGGHWVGYLPQASFFS